MRLVKNNNFKDLGLQITLSITTLVVVLDQLIKNKIRANGGFYFCNKGISFGFSFPVFIFWLSLGLLFVISSSYYLKVLKNKQPPLFLSLGLGFFWGGVLANSLDRLFFGCVFDYFSFLGQSFPLFNLADITISVGGLLLSVFLLRKNPNLSV